MTVNNSAEFDTQQLLSCSGLLAPYCPSSEMAIQSGHCGSHKLNLAVDSPKPQNVCLLQFEYFFLSSESSCPPSDRNWVKTEVLTLQGMGSHFLGTDLVFAESVM